MKKDRRISSLETLENLVKEIEELLPEIQQEAIYPTTSISQVKQQIEERVKELRTVVEFIKEEKLNREALRVYMVYWLRNLIEFIKNLPDLPVEISQEIENILYSLVEQIEKLIEEHFPELRQKKEAKLRFEWEGALKHLRKQYTSVELQHKISEWR